jgi:uncharacterized RDD family membrane protein YckC
MENEQSAVASNHLEYGGFWRRFVAFIIDSCLVSIVVFPLIAAVDLVFPGRLVVTTPLDLFSEEQVLETQKSVESNSDGSQTAVETKIVERKYLNTWTYTYRVIEKSNAGKSETDRQLIDPTSRLDIAKTTTDTIEFYVLLLYLVLMESSRHQASLGKMALGLKVQDKNGNRLTPLRALGRNAAKLLSFITLLIGFMMAGWTRRKQALHDMVAECLIVKA